MAEWGRHGASWDVSPPWTTPSGEGADVGEDNDRRPVIRRRRVRREGASEGWRGGEVDGVAALPSYLKGFEGKGAIG